MATKVQDFFAYVDSDQSISQKYDALDNRQDVLNFAKEHGYEFTEEEFVAHFENSNLNLDNISGGSGVTGMGSKTSSVSRPCPCLP